MARILVGLKAVPAAAVQNVERSALHAHARVMEQLEVWRGCGGRCGVGVVWGRSCVGEGWGEGLGQRCVGEVAGQRCETRRDVRLTRVWSKLSKLFKGCQRVLVASLHFCAACLPLACT